MSPATSATTSCPRTSSRPRTTRWPATRQTGQEDDQIGADREGDPDTAPLTEEDADYGSGGDS